MKCEHFIFGFLYSWRNSPALQPCLDPHTIRLDMNLLKSWISHDLKQRRQGTDLCNCIFLLLTQPLLCVSPSHTGFLLYQHHPSHQGGTVSEGSQVFAQCPEQEVACSVFFHLVWTCPSFGSCCMLFLVALSWDGEYFGVKTFLCKVRRAKVLRLYIIIALCPIP